MDVGLPTAASDSAAALPIQLRPHPPFEQESGHGREHEAYSNGKVTMGDERQSSAQVAKRAADAASASSSDAGDAELQRRKAALLQQVEDALASAGSSTTGEAPAAAAADAGQPLQGSAPAAQEVPSTPAAAPAPAQPAAPRKQPYHKADSAAQQSLSPPPPPPDLPTLPPTITDLPSRIVEAAAADEPSSPAPAASQPAAPALQACFENEAAAQQMPPALAATEPAPTTAPAAPRRLKLQPGDFYITLPKPPTLATPRGGAQEGGEAGASARQAGHSQPDPPGLADATDLPQAANAAVEAQSSPEQGSRVPSRTAPGSRAAAEELPSNSEGPADAVSSNLAGQIQELGQAGQQAAIPVPEWRQESNLRADIDAAEAFSEQQSSSRARQAAAAARKEEAQELALEQAILEVHWRQAQEGALPGGGSAEERYEGQANAVGEDHHNTAAAAAELAFTSGHGNEDHEGAGWGAGNAATPWTDRAAVEGPFRAGKHAGAPFAGYYTEAAGAAGSRPYEPVADRSASSGVSGQWAPAELAAQAKAWADWAALQAQSSAQSSNQSYGYSSPEAATATEGAEAAKGSPGQGSPAELAAQAKAWADWAAWQAQSGAQSPSQEYTYAFPEAATATEGAEAANGTSGQGPPAELAAQAEAWADWAAWQAQSGAQGCNQDSSCTVPAAAAQPDDAGTVSIPVSMYRRYQQLEWAEWWRQYEGWQKHMAEWQKQYVHWYSSYISWYSQSGSAAVQ